MDNQIRANNPVGSGQLYVSKNTGPEKELSIEAPEPVESFVNFDMADLAEEDALMRRRLVSDFEWNLQEPEVTVFNFEPEAVGSKAPKDGASSGETQSLSIIFTNDLHGNLDPNKGKGGMAYVAGKIDELRAKSPDSIVVDGGDISYAPPYSDKNRFNPMTVIMDEIKYDAMAAGNHEFQWEARKHDGPEGNPNSKLTDNLKELTEHLGFPVLCANAERMDIGKRPDYLKPYIIKQVGDVNVGIIGVVTKKMATSAHPEVAQGWKILDQADSINKLMPEIKAKGADLIVVVSHDSLGRNEEMIRRTHDVDIVIGGHDHQETPKPIGCTNADGKIVPLVEAGSHGYVVGQLKVDIDSGSKKIKQVTSTLHPVLKDKVKPDPVIADIVDKWIGKKDR